MKNGALGYLLKDVEPAMLIKAIHVVNEGNAFVYPKLAERLFGGLNEAEDLNEKAREMWRESRSERLTAREMDVLSCIAKGFSNQDIAQALFVSEKTVKNHLTNIFRKLNVNDRTQALIYVLKHKIMGVANLPYITSQLISNGRPADTPAAVIRWGTKPEQRVLVTDLEHE